MRVAVLLPRCTLVTGIGWLTRSPQPPRIHRRRRRGIRLCYMPVSIKWICMAPCSSTKQSFNATPLHPGMKWNLFRVLYNFPKAFRPSHPQPLRKSCCWRGINRKSYYCTSIWVIRMVNLLNKSWPSKELHLTVQLGMTMRMQAEQLFGKQRHSMVCICKNVSQLLTCVNELGINKQFI